MSSTCTTLAPPGQDINAYLTSLNTILQTLDSKKNKDVAVQGIDLMIATIKAVILKADPTHKF